MTAAIETSRVGRCYGLFWALRDATVSLPAGSITALVGPNGAGKTTLLNLLVGLLPASEGDLRVAGFEPNSTAEFLALVGFVAQDCPLYREFTVGDLLRFGRAMNPTWDDGLARSRLAAAEVPLARRAGRLSGGQRAQVALAIAVAKRPKVLLLDEPLASLDPLARRHFLQTLIESVASAGITVVMSSHLIGELARVCDHLVVLRDGRLCLAGELDQLRSEHHWVAGPAEQTTRLPAGAQVLSQSRHERHRRLLVRTTEPLFNPELTVDPVDIEELVLAYLERPAGQPVLADGGPR